MNIPPMGQTAPDARLPRYQQVRDDLVRRIAAAEWQPETAIPTEAELCKAYDVSTGTLRKAIDLLVAEGVITRSQGRGTFVRRPSFNASLFRFFRFRSNDGQPVVPTSRVLSCEVAAADAAVRDSLNIGPRDKAIQIKRMRQVDGRTVVLEDIWLPHGPFKALLKLPLDEFGDLLYPLYERLCRQVVATASEILSVETASKATATHLGIPLQGPVIRVERTAFDYAGRPIEWRASRGAADGFRYQVDIR